MDLNRQTASSQSLVTFTSISQNINTALSGFRKAFFNLATIEATGYFKTFFIAITSHTSTTVIETQKHFWTVRRQPHA